MAGIRRRKGGPPQKAIAQRLHMPPSTLQCAPVWHQGEVDARHLALSTTGPPLRPKRITNSKATRPRLAQGGNGLRRRAGRRVTGCLRCSMSKLKCDRSTTTCQRCRDKGLECERFWGKNRHTDTLTSPPTVIDPITHDFDEGFQLKNEVVNISPSITAVFDEDVLLLPSDVPHSNQLKTRSPSFIGPMTPAFDDDNPNAITLMNWPVMPIVAVTTNVDEWTARNLIDLSLGDLVVNPSPSSTGLMSPTANESAFYSSDGKQDQVCQQWLLQSDDVQTQGFASPYWSGLGQWAKSQREQSEQEQAEMAQATGEHMHGGG